MKITKKQLRRIIKEERAKLLRESEKWDNLDAYGNPKDGPKIYGPDAAAAGVGVAAQKMSSKSRSSATQALGNLHTAIDGVIKALGNEEAYLELSGIVEDWEHN